MQGIQKILSEEFRLISLKKAMIVIKRKRETDFNIKNRTEQSEIINKTPVSFAEAGNFNISDLKDKKETGSFKKVP